MRFVELSRQALAETLLAAGPDAPTLCEGWRSQELAAHLYLREHRPIVGLGLIVPALNKVTESATTDLAERSSTPSAYRELVEKFRARPAALSPFRIRKVDEAANLVEYFVHTEDVIRASDKWAPRTLDGDYSQALWDDLVKRAALLYRSVDLGVVLVSTDGPHHVAKRAPDSVAIVGDPGELVLHAFGRGDNALVTFEGEPDAVALLQSAHIGI